MQKYFSFNTSLYIKKEGKTGWCQINFTPDWVKLPPAPGGKNPVPDIFAQP